MSRSHPIRSVTDADVPQVVAHVRLILAEFDIQFGVGATSDDELLQLPASYVTRGGAFWVIEEGNRIVGTAGVMPLNRDQFELRKMYLLPEVRGLGLGSALLDRSISFAKEQGAKELVLDTVHRMTDAIALYERRGFIRDDSHISAPRCNRGYALKL